MTKKRKLQIFIDLTMTILLPLLMAYEMIGKVVHEWLGMSMFFLFILHHILNFSWHKSLFKGHYTVFRILGTAINLILLLLMVGLMVSGLILSRHLFVFLPITGGRAAARLVHLLASYWAFALMSLHAGFHGGLIMGLIKKAVKVSEPSVMRTNVLRCMTVIVTVYGIYVFVTRQIADYMFFKSQFVFFDFDEPVLFFLIDYMAMMGLGAISGYYVSKLIQKKFCNKKDIYKT